MLQVMGLNAKEQKRLDMLNLKCLGTILGVMRVDHLRNDSVRERCD